METRNIFPERETFIKREPKEKSLNQRGLVIWFTGLSGSGKSTLSKTLEQKLHQAGYLTQVLDGDKIRNGLCIDLGFSERDRNENIRRIAEVSKLFCRCGIITISAFISPTREIRRTARQIIGDDDFFEIFLNTPIETCEKRDNKGLYQRARKGEIENFTGISSPYEDPINPNVILDTTDQDIMESTDIIFNQIINLVKYQ